MDIQVEEGVPRRRIRVAATYAPYFDALVHKNYSVLVKYEEFTNSAKHKLYADLSRLAHRRKCKGQGTFSIGKEATGVRIWRV